MHLQLRVSQDCSQVSAGTGDSYEAWGLLPSSCGCGKDSFAVAVGFVEASPSGPAGEPTWL